MIMAMYSPIPSADGHVRGGIRRADRIGLPHLTIIFLLAVTLIGRVNAAGSAAVASSQRVVSVQPTDIILSGEGWSRQLLVTGSYADGVEIDRTSSGCHYQSLDPDVVTVSSTGLVRAVGHGSTIVHVVTGESQVEVSVRVEDQVHVPVRFLNDVVPVMTKFGCNAGGCHGKSTGQNGFKLSLLGFDASRDYETLVYASRGRRISLAAPDQSLLLLKATGGVPHGGGKRLDVDSDDYRVLRQWIADGAQPPSPSDPVLERIVVQPGSRTLLPDSQQQLIVTACFSDGQFRDVTRQTVYISNEPEIAEVGSSGLVRTASRSGVFAIMARFGEQIEVFHGSVPFSTEPTGPIQPASQLTEMDDYLIQQWQRLNIRPSAEVDDAAFLRRASLDICGTLPTVDEVSQYVEDDRSDKRERWIDQLLARPEYASYFTLKWADILQNRGGGYSTSQQRAGTTLFANWICDSIATNKPYDEFVAEILTASGSQREHAPTVWYRTVRTTPEYVESVAQAFLGVRVQCAQCHHHPFERWSQADYYGLAAVFARIGRKGGFADAEVPTEEIIFLKDSGEVLHPRTGQIMRPKPLGGSEFDVHRFVDPRRDLARWMVDPRNRYLARTMVNRMWGHFFGRGIIHPIDDARSTNPATNPDLLAALTDDFISSGYDVKQLLRVLCNSYAYRLSSLPNDTNRDDAQNFARFYPRRLSAEVLLDAISQVLEVPTQFPGGPGEFPSGTRAIELPDENVAVHFLDVFGRPDRTSACECERNALPALGQALELVNSAEIQRKLMDENGYVARLTVSERSSADVVKEIFVRTLARPPRPEEQVAAVEFLDSEADPAQAYRSLLWSLIATSEFLFNH